MHVLQRKKGQMALSAVPWNITEQEKGTGNAVAAWTQLQEVHRIQRPASTLGCTVGERQQGLGWSPEGGLQGGGRAQRSGSCVLPPGRDAQSQPDYSRAGGNPNSASRQLCDSEEVAYCLRACSSPVSKSHWQSEYVSDFPSQPVGIRILKHR